MELHRLLTFAAAVLLAATLFLYYGYDDNGSGQDEARMQYAYATGIAMLAAFVASFVIFTRQKMKRGFAS